MLRGVGRCRSAASGVSMPAGAVGIWYADAYDAATRAIPNALSAQALSANIIRGPKRIFNADGELWAISNITFTAGVDDGIGGTTAQRCQGTGTGGYLFVLGNSITCPAGAYTLGIKIRVHSGDDQNFTMTFPNDPGTATTKTATAAYQTLILTGTTAGGSENPIFLRGIGSTAFDFDVAGVAFVAGTKNAAEMQAIIEEPLAGHMYLGKNQFTGPSASGGKLNLENANTTSFGVVQFAEALSISTFTLVSVVERTEELTGTAGAVLMTSITGGSGRFTQQIANNNANVNDLASNLGNKSLALRVSVENSMNIVDEGPLIVTSSWDGTFQNTSVNGARVIYNPMDGRLPSVTGAVDDRPTVPVSVSDFYVGKVYGDSSTGGFKLIAQALYMPAITAAQQRQAETALRARAAQSAITVAQGGRFLCFEGDSNTTRSVTGGVYSYPAKIQAHLNDKFIISDYAYTGAKIYGDGSGNGLIERGPYIDEHIVAGAGYEYTLSIMIGTNVFGDSLTPAQVYAQLATYVAARRAAGWDRIVIQTVPPSNTALTFLGVGFDAWRGTFNALILANSIGADGVVDTTQDANIGPDSVVDSDSVYFLNESGLRYHYDNAGHEIVAQLVADVINAL